MQVVCAWCQREDGITTVLRDVPPIEDRSPTHGLCDKHALALLLSSRSTLDGGTPPRRRLLLIVRADRPDVYQWLAASVAAVDDVEIVIDQRTAERRRASVPVPADRRHAERRGPHVTTALDANGWAGVIEAPRSA